MLRPEKILKYFVAEKLKIKKYISGESQSTHKKILFSNRQTESADKYTTVQEVYSYKYGISLVWLYYTKTETTMFAWHSNILKCVVKHFNYSL